MMLRTGDTWVCGSSTRVPRPAPPNKNKPQATESAVIAPFSPLLLGAGTSAWIVLKSGMAPTPTAPAPAPTSTDRPPASPADMQRGTITITNVGVFGVDNGTPIINPGESAILCFGAVRDMPWVHDGALAVRKVTQLSLSFDHRIVDGQLGSKFLADVAALLNDPALFLAWS